MTFAGRCTGVADDMETGTEPDWGAPADMEIETKTETKSRTRSRGWVWTYQLDTDWDRAWELYQTVHANLKKAFEGHWAMWRPEQCPKTGRIHLQGATYWTSPKSFETQRKFTPHYCAKMRGTVEDSVAYITKLETGCGEVWEMGQRPKSNGKQGQRTDLAEVKVWPHESRGSNVPLVALRAPRGPYTIWLMNCPV